MLVKGASKYSNLFENVFWKFSFCQHLFKTLESLNACKLPFNFHFVPMICQTLQEYGPMTPNPSAVYENLFHMLCSQDMLHG